MNSTMEPLSAEVAAKLKLLRRLLISYDDFHHASRIASYIIDHRLHEKVDRLRGRRRYRIKLLWEALNSAMTVAYCRPFSANDPGRKDTLGNLPDRFLRGLSSEELEVHRTAIEDRNTLLAHSDSDAWNLRLLFLRTTESGKATLLPLHNSVRAPLVHDAVVVLDALCTKLMDRIVEQRAILEKELAAVIPAVTLDDLAQNATGTEAG
jgi:hypothetical protein